MKFESVSSKLKLKMKNYRPESETEKRETVTTNKLMSILQQFLSYVFGECGDEKLWKITSTVRELFTLQWQDWVSHSWKKCMRLGKLFFEKRLYFLSWTFCSFFHNSSKHYITSRPHPFTSMKNWRFSLNSNFQTKKSLRCGSEVDMRALLNFSLSSNSPNSATSSSEWFVMFLESFNLLLNKYTIRIFKIHY